MYEAVPAATAAYHRGILERYFTRRGIPGHRPEPFARGANNILYYCRIRGRPAVAKIGVNPLYRRLHLENEVLRHVGGTGPEAVDFFIDDEDGVQVLLLEYIEGSHPRSLGEEQLMRIGALIAGYHACPRDLPMVPAETCREFLAERILPAVKSGAGMERHGRFSKLYALAEAMAAPSAERFPGSGRVLVHGDLIPGNIIVDNSGLFRIIDWEGVRYDAPEADIATLVKAFNLDGDGIGFLLKGYALPVDAAALQYRLLLHYLQVIAWRVAFQLPKQDARRDAVTAELDGELDAAEAMAETLTSMRYG